ncbi:MAG TPA: alpha-ketoacid dehydrogenase subunit beta [Candidatus Methylomirabilis sp.]|nr:alpha-ketoacid dehydrogenase subunit beta [Candidatus Methylomirabilis sp.]
MRQITYREAIREALREEMRRDERVFVFGEDVADAGGVFKVTLGLLSEFGPERIFDTPLSESAIVGAAVGASLMGMRPVAEVMFADFTTIAMDAIVNHAAKVHYMSGGEMTAPLVVRMAYGAGPKWGSHHTQSVESWLANVPGLTIVMPSTPADAKGLLKAAVRTPNPVIFLEHKLLYGKKGDVPEGEYLVPIGRAAIVHPGEDVTIVASGMMVDRALGAARTLAGEGLGAEVIDLRSVQPLDEETVLGSVEKTGRLVIVHEAPVRGGFGGEVAAVVANQALGFLDAPIQRVGAPWTPVPFGPVLTDAYVPKEADILQAVRATQGAAV